MSVPVPSLPEEVHFGVYTLDVRAGELRKNGMQLKLQDRPFQILAILLERAGEVVTREQLRARLWPDGTFVDFDHSISSAVRKLRDALNDSAATPRYIETVGRRGYRFICPVALRSRLNVISFDSPRDGRPAELVVQEDEPDSVPAPPAASVARRWGPAAIPQRIFLPLAGIGIAIVVAIAAYGVYRLARGTPRIPFHNFTVVKVTDAGNAALTAISPDGKYVLIARRDNGQESLWLRHLPTRSTTQVEPPAEGHYVALRFSPNGNYIYFAHTEAVNAELHHLYRVPLLGGKPQLIVKDIDSNITFSPDGREIAFIRYNDPPGTYRLLIHSLQDGSDRTLISGSSFTAVDSDPTWSPDGKTIVESVFQPGGAAGGLLAVEVANGRQKLIFRSQDTTVERPVWLPDQSGLLFVYRDMKAGFRGQIGFVSDRQPKLFPVTRDPNTYPTFDVAADSKTVAAVALMARRSFSIAPASRLSPVVSSPIPSLALGQTFSWTSDGRLLYTQSYRLYVSDADGTNARELLGEANVEPIIAGSACGNGGYIVFAAVRNVPAIERIWRMDASGANATEISTGMNDQFPLCSPDGQWVFYRDQSASALMRVSIEGGKPEQIADDIEKDTTTFPFDVSPDGKYLVVAVPEHAAGQYKKKFIVYDLVARQQVASRRFLPFHSPLPRFTPDRRAIVYPVHDGAADNLWLEPLDGSPGKWITHFKNEQIYDFHWSLDGSRFALIRGHTDSDVVLIHDSQ